MREYNAASVAREQNTSVRVTRELEYRPREFELLMETHFMTSTDPVKPLSSRLRRTPTHTHHFAFYLGEGGGHTACNQPLPVDQRHSQRVFECVSMCISHDALCKKSPPASRV